MLFGTVSSYFIQTASLVQETLDWMAALSPDESAVLIIDLGLPDGDGTEIISCVTAGYSNVAIIVVTSRTDLDSKLASLQQGADAYLSKPFDERELMMTVSAVCRRAFPGSILQPQNHWKLKTREWSLVTPSGVTIRLSIPETQLLDILQRNGNKPVSRLKISESLGDIYRYSGNALEAMVSRLRKKIANVSPDTEVIRAVNGVGYVLAVDVH
jgi:two-component system response regulator QseB/two-component system response regulator TctD